MGHKTKSTSKATTTDAAAGAATRRTVSDTEQAQTTARQDQITDVGVDEATQSAVLDQTRNWNANTKQAYDTLCEELHANVKSAQDHLNSIRTIQQQMLTNMVVNCDNLQKQHLAHRDVSTDRTWNVDEVSTLTAKSGAQADALVVALVEALRKANG